MAQGRGNQITLGASIEQVVRGLLHHRPVELEIVSAPQHVDQLPAGGP
jgi:hypothetical protein